MLAGVNDGDDQVRALVGRLRRPLYHLNLIAYNETGGEFARPEPRELAALYDRLDGRRRDLHGEAFTRGRDRGRLRPARPGQSARSGDLAGAPRAPLDPAPPIALVAAATAR